jgi:hypothetical protein
MCRIFSYSYIMEEKTIGRGGCVNGN